jgi:hypothetical protein
MKTLLHTLLVAAALVMGSTANAQASASSQLDNIIDLTDDVKGNAKDTRQAAKTLRFEYFDLSAPNLAGFNASITNLQINGVDVHADDIIFSAQQAQAANPALDITNILYYANELKMLVNEITDQALDLQTAIPNGDVQEIKSSIRIIAQSARQQILLSKQIKLEAETLLPLTTTYNVRIQLQDAYGTIYSYGQTGLQGIYALNTANGQYIYPNQGDPIDELLNLPNGTYTFGSYDGYFDGAGTTTVTLSNEPVGADGYIVITLSYWSE